MRNLGETRANPLASEALVDLSRDRPPLVALHTFPCTAEEFPRSCELILGCLHGAEVGFFQDVPVKPIEIQKIAKLKK